MASITVKKARENLNVPLNYVAKNKESVEVISSLGRLVEFTLEKPSGPPSISIGVGRASRNLVNFILMVFATGGSLVFKKTCKKTGKPIALVYMVPIKKSEEQKEIANRIRQSRTKNIVSTQGGLTKEMIKRVAAMQRLVESCKALPAGRTRDKLSQTFNDLGQIFLDLRIDVVPEFGAKRRSNSRDLGRY